MRRINPRQITGITPPASFGPAPDLRWLPIDQLVVDPSYQREIGRRGDTHIRKIAEGFDWRLFSAVVVSPVEGGRFAIIDGQHRTTAAALCGIKEVPAMVIQADAGQQARAFEAINGNTRRIGKEHRYKAALAAGDAATLRVRALTSAAGVNLKTSIPSKSAVRPGDTIAHTAIEKLCANFNDQQAAFILGLLKPMVRLPEIFIRTETVQAITDLFLENLSLIGSAPAAAALRALDQEELFASARELSAREKGLTIRECMIAAMASAIEDLEDAA